MVAYSPVNANKRCAQRCFNLELSVSPRNKKIAEKGFQTKYNFIYLKKGVKKPPCIILFGRTYY